MMLIVITARRDPRFDCRRIEQGLRSASYKYPERSRHSPKARHHAAIVHDPETGSGNSFSRALAMGTRDSGGCRDRSGLFVAGGAQALLILRSRNGGRRAVDDDQHHARAFYLLPAFPMMAPRVVRLLATRMTYARATQVAATVGQGFAFVFGFSAALESIPDLYRTFRLYRASQEAALAQMKDVSRRFPVSSAMVGSFAHSLKMPGLQEAVDALLATSQHDFPVVDETGSVAGLLTRHDLIAACARTIPTARG